MNIKLSKDADMADRQVLAIIFYLAAFAYIDGEFDAFERMFVKQTIDQLVSARVEAAGGEADDLRAQFIHGFQRVDDWILGLFRESYAENESLETFVYAKLKLRALEIFTEFGADNQRVLLETVDGLIEADGVIHPAEQAFRDEVQALVREEGHHEEISLVPTNLEVLPARKLAVRRWEHEFFTEVERPFTQATHEEVAQDDRDIIDQVVNRLADLRSQGKGMLTGVRDVGSYEERFVDGTVEVLPPKADTEYELLVLGDLHGCYSCFKAATLQFDFFKKVDAHIADPANNPEPHIVFLGDYLDRGRFGLEGCLRAALALYARYPQYVHVLRGNHEWFLERGGTVRSGVKPAESLDRWIGILGIEHFKRYIQLFEYLPTHFFFDRTLFVHAGIPREDTFEEWFDDLNGLNHPLVRFQMMWSDPSAAPYVPVELQSQNARFPFGRDQFRNFMAHIGANVLIRGHEKINDGFELFYEDDDALLITLFSAGGRENRDLPPKSGYRRVTPKALTLSWKNGKYTAQPWDIDYVAFRRQERNNFAPGMWKG